MKLKKRIVSLRWLLFAVLLTSSVSSVTLSRFMTKAAGGEAARVAKFHVEVSGDNELSIDGSDTIGNLGKNYTLTIRNDSETAITYTVELVTATAIAAGVQFSMGDISYQTDGTQKSFLFKGFILEPNKEIQQNLTVTALLAELKDDIDTKIEILVHVEQVD